MAERQRVRIVVTGIVQGVAFRHCTRAEAERLGLDGWVRNLPDGRVEVAAEGPRARLESLVAWCWRGPPAARVSRVETDWQPPQGEAGFEIVR